MPLTTEVLIFATNEASRDNPHIANPAYDIVLGSKGVRKPAYYGLQDEDPKTGYFFLNWDSYEDHLAVMQDQVGYAKLIEALKPALNGEPEMYHVEFSAPTIAFDQPFTEVLVLTLKAPENRDSVEKILSKLSEATKKMLVYGKTREDENKYIVVGGWQTVQAHWETVAAPEVDQVLRELYSLANKDHLYHTALFKYPKDTK